MCSSELYGLIRCLWLVIGCIGFYLCVAESGVGGIFRFLLVQHFRTMYHFSFISQVFTN